MQQIMELTFLSQLSKRSKLPVPDFATTPLDRRALKSLLDKWGKAVVKPDILAGKKGKIGLVKEVDNPARAAQEINHMLNVDIGGKMPRTVYLTRYIPAELEIYTAITYNSSCLGPSLTVSLKGGMDIESVKDKYKRTISVDIYKGLDAYQASHVLSDLQCPQKLNSIFSRCMVNFWDFFITNGLRMCEINPWRVTPNGNVYACDFKAILDESNFKAKNLAITFPEYPENFTPFEEEMKELAASSYQGQLHVSDLRGDLILPILFGGGASTIITETLVTSGGNPIFLSDFGGNPTYERMHRTALVCFKHYLKKASLLLILGGKANNTLIDVTFQAIGDALQQYVEENGPVHIPVVIGRGGPRLAKGLTIMKEIIDTLRLPYVIFGHDTPATLVAEYASRLAKAYAQIRKK